MTVLDKQTDVSDTISIDIDLNSLKTKQLYIVEVLVDTIVNEENKTVFIKPYSNCITSLLRNGNVDKDTFFKEAIPATVMDMSKPSVSFAYYKMLKDNGITLNWDEAEAALAYGIHLTRRLWIENNVFLTVYKEIKEEQNDQFKIYSNGKHKLSTGWIPTEEDKRAIDWSILSIN